MCTCSVGRLHPVRQSLKRNSEETQEPPTQTQKGYCVSSPSFHLIFGRFLPLRYFGRSCSGTLPKAPSNHRFGVLFLDDQAKLVKIALAEATMNTPRALDLMGFGIESQEPIFFRASMQCTMKNADFTAFRKRIMEAVELCHHRASCGARTAPSPASIPRV